MLLELLLRKEPVFTTESGIKQNLCNYFLSEMRTRSTTEIVAAKVLEEATQEEIEKVSLPCRDVLEASRRRKAYNEASGHNTTASTCKKDELVSI